MLIMINGKNRMPLYVQLYEELLNEIVSGKWKVGHLLPSEKALTEQYSVSRITVRQALEQLRNEDYIVRKSGKGTFVKAQPIEQELSNFYSFSDDMKNKGFKIENNVITCEKRIASEYVATKLNLKPNAEIIFLERIRSVDDIAFAYETSYIPYKVCPRLTGEFVKKIGLYNSLKELGLIVPDSANESFEAVMPTAKIAEYLDMNNRQPALKIERITKSGEKIIEFCHSIVRGNRIKYNVILRSNIRKE